MPDYASLIHAFREETATPRRAARRRAPNTRGWGIPVVLASVAAAAAWVLWPRPVDGPLVTGALTRDVHVEVDGSGTAMGTGRELRLTWDAGALGVEVEPGRGVELLVRTPEAEVEVVGTGFDVVRDALGTSVHVRHGRVRVACTGGEASELGPADSTTCLPTSAAGRLGRVRALQARGAPWAEEVVGALALPDATGSVHDELQAAQLDGYVSSGDPRAFALAEVLAGAGGPRALTAHRIAARLAAGCGPALPHLEALAAAGVLDEDVAAWERCRSGP